MTADGQAAPTGEQLRRIRAARALYADDPAARGWLADVRRHTDPDIVRLAERAQHGEIPVASVVSAVEHAERVEARAEEIQRWLSTHSRDELVDLLQTQGVVVPTTTAAQTITMAQLPLSDASRAFLKQAGLWSDTPRTVRLDDLTRVVDDIAADVRITPR